MYIKFWQILFIVLLLVQSIIVTQDFGLGFSSEKHLNAHSLTVHIYLIFQILISVTSEYIQK